MQYNFTHELSELLHFTAGVGTAARLFSAYFLNGVCRHEQV